MNNPKNFTIFFILMLISCILNLCTIKVYAQVRYPPLAYYDVIEKRNIFRPTKDLDALPQSNSASAFDDSDESDENISSEKSQNQVNDLLLTGIIRIRGIYKAIIEKKSEGKGYYVVEGDYLDGYNIKEIRRSHVQLEQNGNIITLTLSKLKSRAKPAKRKTKTVDTTDIETFDAIETQDEEFMKRSNGMQTIRMGIFNAVR